MKKLLIILFLIVCCPIVHASSLSPKEEKIFIEKAIKAYPFKRCVVSGDALDEDTVNYVYEEKKGDQTTYHLIRFCCKDCIKEFKRNPQKYINMIERYSREKALELKESAGINHDKP
jgi:YHS domain-containing protein